MRKGQKVQVKPHQRTRTIFNNSEVSPGSTKTHKGGWAGTVTNIFKGALPVEVKKDGTSPGVGYYEFAPEEIKIVD